MAENTIISTGGTFRIYDEAVVAHNALPAGTYRVQFSMMGGYSLQRADQLTSHGERVYGDHAKRVDRAILAFKGMSRSMGIMMSGDKGMGKSLMIRLLADGFHDQLGMPVILVDKYTEGIAEFIDTLGEVVVVFDEFEKKFDEREQETLLGLFDGISTTRRVYIVSLNEINRTSAYLVNRPGRFHYHYEFTYPDAAQVREYLNDTAPNAAKEDIDKAVMFSRKVAINYDHLRAIAYELELGGSFGSIISDINIKRTRGHDTYIVTTTYADGSKHTGPASLNLYGESDFGDEAGESGIEYSAYSSGKLTGIDIRADLTKLTETLDGLKLEGDAITGVYNSVTGEYENPEDFTEEARAYSTARSIRPELPVSVHIEIKRPASNAY